MAARLVSLRVFLRALNGCRTGADRNDGEGRIRHFPAPRLGQTLAFLRQTAADLSARIERAYGAQFFGAFVVLPPVSAPSELARSHVQESWPPKQSGEFGVGVWQLRMSRKPPSGFVPPPPLLAQHSTRPGIGEHAGSVGLVAQLQVGASIAHIGLPVEVPPPLLAAPQVHTPSFGFVVPVPVPPGRPGMPPATAEGCTQLEPLVALQNATTPSHLPVVS